MATKIINIDGNNRRGQANFRLSKPMLDTLADVSQALNMSQADFLEFLFWHFGEKAAKLSQEQVVELTSKVTEKLRAGRAQLDSPPKVRKS